MSIALKRSAFTSEPLFLDHGSRRLFFKTEIHLHSAPLIRAERIGDVLFSYVGSLNACGVLCFLHALGERYGIHCVGQTAVDSTDGVRQLLTSSILQMKLLKIELLQIIRRGSMTYQMTYTFNNELLLSFTNDFEAKQSRAFM